MWAIDFQFDETSDRRRIKLCNIVDEYTREALAIRVGRSCTADDVVEVINGLVASAAHRISPLRQRPGVHRMGTAGLLPNDADGHKLHRARQPVGESVC